MFLLFALLTAAAGFVGSRFRPDAWFAGLAKPGFNPPDAAFAPVWTVLYVCIAVAGWLAWRRTRSWRSPALAVWAVQLLLNAAWSALFFGLHAPGLALLDVTLLLASILAFLVLTWRTARAAAVLFLPYALWVGFATVLNASIWALN